MEPEAHRKSRDQFQAQAANYGQSHILANTADVSQLLKDLPTPDPGTPALDIATGGGHCALALARFGYRLSVCDITPAMVEQSRAQLTANDFPAAKPGLEDAICPAEALPYPSESFALVSCRVAAHHFADPAAFVDEVARVLRPGGSFILIDGSVPDNDPATASWINHVEKLRDPSHETQLDQASWQSFVKASGLEVLHSELSDFPMSDLEVHFKNAATSEANRQAVLEQVQTATEPVRRAMKLQNEPGQPISWVWQRISLLVRKPERDEPLAGPDA